MLYLALERLVWANGVHHQDIWVVQDNHGNVDERIAEVVESFRLRLKIDYRVREPNPWIWGGASILLAYKEAYESGADMVFMVEDDCMVTRDFFDWHYAIHSKEECFASVGYCPWTENSDPEKYFRSHAYCAIGLSFQRKSLEHILPHVNERCFTDPRDYILENLYYPETSAGSPMPDSDYGQDGLIGRIVLREGLWNISPDFPRCFHSGLYGLNRRQDSPLKEGTWQEQAAELKMRWEDPEWMMQDYPDCRPVLKVPEWRSPRAG
jgi:hypothetical protein